MKHFKTGLKIYFILFIYLFISLFCYAIFLDKFNKNESKIVELIIGSIAFIVLTALYSNHFQKKGLIVGVIVGVIHIFLLFITTTLTGNKYEFSFLVITIYLFSSMIGGIIGINFNKLV